MNSTPTIVYIADDNDGDRFFLREAIEEIDSDISLLELSSAEALLEKLNDSSVIPQIIFLDLFMPQRDGVSCLKEIRKNRKYDNTKVIIFSNSSAYVVVDEAYNHGAAHYIRKSMSFKDTLNVLQDVFKSITSPKFRPTRESFYIA